LSGNEISSSGANAVIEAVENKTHLETLDLDCKYN